MWREFPMWHQIRQTLSWMLLIMALVGLILFGLVTLTTQPVVAEIRQQAEAPGQILYQSRHSLKDETGKSWQVVLFKRVKAGEPESVSLRLVGFPGTAEFVHPQPLTINTDAGEVLQAEDGFAEEAPAPHIGQYDLETVLPELPPGKPLTLELPLSDPLEISIPGVVVLEWQTVAAQG